MNVKVIIIKLYQIQLHSYVLQKNNAYQQD